MKFIKKKFRKGARYVRKSVANNTPLWMHRVFGPWFDYFDMLILDHGILRALYSNLHPVSDGVWRASQPTPRQIRHYSKKGIRTIVNLRGERVCGGYRLEEQVCRKYGIELVNLSFSSRNPPTRERILEAKKMFETIEYPFVMHCKSGADRAGLVSALYLLLRENKPIDIAQKQLSLKYGHIRQAETGILDHFFEQYVEAKKERDLPFLEWVNTVYDPQDLRHSFQSNAWAIRFVNLVLQRE